MNNAMVKVLIVDDEQSSIDVLKTHLDAYKNYEICGEARDLTTALELTCITKPDLIFLDIVLGNNDTAFDFLDAFLPKVKFKVIFITAFDEFAVRAFNYNALHYLLKPIEQQNFDKALSRMNDEVNQKQYVNKLKSLAEDLEHNKHKHLFINTTKKVHKLDVEDILYLEANNNYTTFHLTNKTKVTASKTLKHYAQILEKEMFFRIHESYIVNTHKVTKYQKRTKTLILEDMVYLPVAVRRSKAFLENWCDLKRG